MKKLSAVLSPLWLALMLSVVGAPLAVAEDSVEDIERTIRQSFKASRPDLKIATVAESPVADLYEVQFESGPKVYTTKDGRYFVLGDLYEIRVGGFVNLAEVGRQAERVEGLKEIDEDDTIAFAAKGERKGVLYVFTDVDCGFCQKLHREVPELNEMGVEVRYLAYPRAGVGSPTYKKMVSAWCAKDKQAAMTALKTRQPIEQKNCADNPVARQYQLGGRMGVTGTPAIVTEDGRLIPGYMPADRLAPLALGATVQ